MMDSDWLPERRVRRLHLGAPDEPLLRRGAFLLEDALRSACLPGEQPGRLLLVRRLDVGRIDSRASPASLSLQIEQRLSQLDGQCVYALLPGADSAGAVYFNIALEALVALGLRLARGPEPREWYWPLACPGWSPGLPRPVAWRGLLAAALRTPAGAGAAVSLLSELQRRDCLEPLLQSLRPQDGPPLLQACDWSRPPCEDARLPFEPGKAQADPLLPGAAPTQVLCPAGWEAPLRRWAGEWGRVDARACFLAAVALAAEKPARLAAPGALAAAAVDLLGTLDDNLSPRRPAQPGPTYAVDDLLSGLDNTPSPVSPVQKGPAEDSWPSPGGSVKPGLAPSNPAALEPYLPKAAEGAELPITAVPPARAAVPAMGPDLAGGATPGNGPADRPVLTGGPSIRPGPAERPGLDLTAGTALSEYAEALPSAAAGLYFLLPLLGRLSLPAFLSSQPHLLELDLTQRILLRAASLAGVPMDDPSLAVLAPSPGRMPDSVEHLSYCVPAAWLGAACRPPSRERPWRICRRADYPQARLLCDHSGRLVLAAWQGRAPHAVKTLLQAGPDPDVQAGTSGRGRIARGRPGPAASDLDLLLDSWVTALRRGLRLETGLSLGEIILRPGRLSLAPAYLGVTFDLSSADLRIRKAGLDLDPGWLPWLGKAVYFYYR